LAIFLPNQGVLGFKTRFLGENKQSLRFETPHKILIAQRRKDRRYRIPRGYEIHLNMGLEGTRMADTPKRLYDLSAGGLAFTVDPKEADVYKPGDVLDKIEMVLRGRRMMFTVEVKNKMALPAGSPVPGVKIGTSFKKLSEQDEEYISAYILEKTIQYLSK
jgi:c-di-GMP-binding flagellar brake protein YcgR